MSLSKTLEEIQNMLVKKDSVRQAIQTSLRKATRLSKQAIFLIHKSNLDEAEKKLTEAKTTFSEAINLSKDNPELIYSGLADTAFEEYAEANIILLLVREQRFSGPEEIGVPPTPYLLGLADVIGELRRRALDFLRGGETKKAEECLELMETIYMELVNLDEAQSLVPGLRRKCDVARRIVEATRGDVTIEVRRSSLEDSIHELEERLEVKRDGGTPKT
jgi:translin